MDIFIVVVIIVILLSLAVHEYAHAAIADGAGDPTPRMFGRVTMNPLNHLDPLGTIFIIMSAMAGMGIGWGRPVPMDPRKMRNPRWDHFWAVAGGPLSNLIIAIICGILLQIVAIAGISSPLLLMVLFAGLFVNVGLFMFNLIPIGPLDGMWLLGTFMNERLRLSWTRFNLTYGMFLLLGLILPIMPGGNSIASFILLPLRGTLIRLLLPGKLEI